MNICNMQNRFLLPCLFYSDMYSIFILVGQFVTLSSPAPAFKFSLHQCGTCAPVQKSHPYRRTELGHSRTISRRKSQLVPGLCSVKIILPIARVITWPYSPKNSDDHSDDRANDRRGISVRWLWAPPIIWLSSNRRALGSSGGRTLTRLLETLQGLNV